MKLKDFFRLIFAILICESAGAIGAIFTAQAISSVWYAVLLKPVFNPPTWVFSPVWTTLYFWMGISLFLVWEQRTEILKNVGMLRVWKRGMALFAIQLALNALWPVIFFGFHNPAVAFIDIAFLWLAILGIIIYFSKISKPASWLLLPYILWVSFATYLNYAFWFLNR